MYSLYIWNIITIDKCALGHCRKSCLHLQGAGISYRHNLVHTTEHVTLSKMCTSFILLLSSLQLVFPTDLAQVWNNASKSTYPKPYTNKQTLPDRTKTYYTNTVMRSKPVRLERSDSPLSKLCSLWSLCIKDSLVLTVLYRGKRRLLGGYYIVCIYQRSVCV